MNPIQNQIQVRDVIPPQSANNPISQLAQSLNDSDTDSEDKDLDKILKDVNSSVKNVEDSPDRRFGHLDGVRKKMAVQKAKVEQGRNGSPPIMATVVACTVALFLSVAAVMLYRHSS